MCGDDEQLERKGNRGGGKGDLYLSAGIVDGLDREPRSWEKEVSLSKTGNPCLGLMQLTQRALVVCVGVWRRQGSAARGTCKQGWSGGGVPTGPRGWEGAWDRDFEGERKRCVPDILNQPTDSVSYITAYGQPRLRGLRSYTG